MNEADKRFFFADLLLTFHSPFHSSLSLSFSLFPFPSLTSDIWDEPSFSGKKRGEIREEEEKGGEGGRRSTVT